MAEENVVRTNIVATSNMSGLISDLNRVTASLSNLQQRLNATNKQLAISAASMSKQFADTLRSTGQFSTHFVSLTSDVEKFGSQLDKGQLKLGQFFRVYQDQVRGSGGLIKQLAQQQVQLQNAILQPLGRNAQGLMQYNVHIPTGLDKVKNATSLAKQELAIMNKVVQEGAGQLINWGKNTQWAGRQLTVGLTVPLAAFGKAAADAFRIADQELVRLTKVYGGLAATSGAELAKVRKDVTQTAAELSKGYGASFAETISLAADIAATGKQGNELLGSIKETTRLAVLGEVDRQEAMKATLAIQTAFKQNTQELSDSINFLNAVENQTSTTLQDLVEAIPKAGPIIKGLGGSVQDLALYLTAMREGGVSAAEGANALKSALGSLINPTQVATKMFAGFGIDLKNIVSKNAGNVTGTILELQAALDRLDPLQKQQALEQLFGKFQFARMNALFSNLGKQGSQTLQVLDLMKASSQDLANVASRELAQVTESASGKYRRAVEGLKADLAGIGDSFLKINTTLINVIDKVIQFVNHLPGPIKSALSFFGMLTAVAGPLIMLTGVLGNFFGYIIKGVYHFKAFFKGAEGWKLLTPEILAANKASNMVEKSMYSDARAAAVLNQALQPLIASYDRLVASMSAGVIHTNPGFVTPMGTVATPGRQVNPASPYITPIDTRHFAHMNPVSMMTSTQKAQQSIFGVVPGPQTVNQRISNIPQVYMTEDLPRIQGITAAGKVSTGVVAGEAAKFHAMTGALGMQTQAEIVKLRNEVARTGLITDELAQSYETLLPRMQEITANAAMRTRQIVTELQANKVTADQARAQIIALNREIETMMVSAAQQTAASLGRNINVTQLPMLNQPAFDPRTGKSNMKELFRQKRGTRQLLNNIASILGVKTYGAPYSIETTIPKKMRAGGQVTGSRGNYGNVYNPNQHGAVVPGPNVNYDIIPANVPVGGFVLNQEASMANPELVALASQGYNAGGQMTPAVLTPGETVVDPLTYMANKELFNRANSTRMSLGGSINKIRTGYGNNPFGTSREVRDLYAGRELAHLTEMLYTSDLSVDQKAKLMKGFGLSFEQVSSPTSRVGSSLFAAYHSFFNQGTNNGNLTISKAIDYLKGKPVLDPKFGMVTHDPVLAYKAMMMDLGIPEENMSEFASNMDKKIISGLKSAAKNGAIFIADTPSGPNQMATSLIGNSVTDYVKGLKDPRMFRSLRKLKMPGEFRIQRPGKSSSARYFPLTTDRVSTMIASVVAKKRMPQKLPALLNVFPRLGKTFNMSPIIEQRTRQAMRRGLFRNSGGVIGGEISTANRNYGNEFIGMPTVGPSGTWSGHDATQRVAGGMGGAMTAGFGLQMAGGFMGGQAGTALMLGGLAMQMAPMLGSLVKMSNLITAGGKGLAAFGSIGTKALAAVRAGFTFLTGPVGLTIAAVTALTVVTIKLTKHFEDLGKANRLMFGGTKETLAEVGLKYESINDKLKNVNAQLELQKAKGKEAYAALTSSGVSGLTLSVKELADKIETVKKNAKETVGAFNNIDSSKVIDLAASLKQQYISAGMSVQDATNNIYAMIKASNKASLALSAITSAPFIAIKDKASAAQYSVELLAKTLSDPNLFNPGEFGRGIDQMLNSIEIYRQSLTDPKLGDKTLSQAEALRKTLEKIKAINGANNKLTEEQINSIRSQNILLGSVLGKTESLSSVYAKMALMQAGFGGDIGALSGDQAVLAAQGMQAYSDAVVTAAKDTKGPLGALSTLYNKAKAASDAAAKSAKKAAGMTTDSIDAEIKKRQKLIDSLQAEQDARLKLLDAQQQQSDFNKSIQQAQIDYQQALAAGDMAQAAQAQLQIQKLTEDRQREVTRTSIQDKYAKEIKALQDEINKLQDKKNLQQNAASLAQTSATNRLADLQAIEGYRNQLIALAQQNPDTASLSEENKKALVGQVKSIIKEMTAQGGAIAAAAQDIMSQYPSIAALGTESPSVVGGKFVAGGKIKPPIASSPEIKLISDLANKGFEGASKTFATAVDVFKEYVLKLAGKEPVVNPFQETKPSKTSQGSLPVGSSVGQIGEAELKSLGANQKTTTVNGKQVKTWSGVTFYKDGKQYVTGNETQPGLGYYDVYPVKKAMGGIIKHFGPGGDVNGPGTSTSDSIPAMLSDGEYVIRAAAVDKYGKELFDGLNAQKFAGGGNVRSSNNVSSSGMPAIPNPFSMGMQWLSSKYHQFANAAIKNIAGIDITKPWSKKSGLEKLSMAGLAMPEFGIGKQAATKTPSVLKMLPGLSEDTSIAIRALQRQMASNRKLGYPEDAIKLLQATRRTRKFNFPAIYESALSEYVQKPLSGQWYNWGYISSLTNRQSLGSNITAYRGLSDADMAAIVGYTRKPSKAMVNGIEWMQKHGYELTDPSPWASMASSWKANAEEIVNSQLGGVWPKYGSQAAEKLMDLSPGLKVGESWIPNMAKSITDSLEFAKAIAVGTAITGGGGTKAIAKINFGKDVKGIASLKNMTDKIGGGSWQFPQASEGLIAPYTKYVLEAINKNAHHITDEKAGVSHLIDEYVFKAIQTLPHGIVNDVGRLAKGGIVTPKYNIPNTSTAMVNPMPMGYNRGGAVHRYDVGGLVVNAAPNHNTREIAMAVVNIMEEKNLQAMAKSGGKQRLIAQ